MTLPKHSLLILALLSSFAGFSQTKASTPQTGLFWFGDTTSTSVNNRIISIKENKDGELYLLGKASDREYKNIHPYWAVCDKAGKLQSQKTIATTNAIFELNNFTICGDDKIRIWGTETVNDRLTLMLNTIDKKGTMPGSDAMMTNTTTLCGDVCQLDSTTAIFAKTVQSSSNGMYHISIYKYNVQDDQQIWYKKLDTEDNEEASKIFMLKDGSFILLAKLYNKELTSFTSLIYRLSATGELIWKKNITAYPSFYAQGISEGKNKSLFYVCSTGSEKDASGSTKIVSLDSSGDEISTKEIPDIRANGILTLKNGNLFVYGAHYQKSGIAIISKACFKMFDAKLNKIKEDELGVADGPDAYLPNLAMSMQPTASDFLTAIQLSDGRIACAGRVYMPAKISADDIILSERVNRALLVLMSPDGKFR